MEFGHKWWESRPNVWHPKIFPGTIMIPYLSAYQFIFTPWSFLWSYKFPISFLIPSPLEIIGYNEQKCQQRINVFSFSHRNTNTKLAFVVQKSKWVWQFYPKFTLGMHHKSSDSDVSDRILFKRSQNPAAKLLQGNYDTFWQSCAGKLALCQWKAFCCYIFRWKIIPLASAPDNNLGWTPSLYRVPLYWKAFVLDTLQEI